MNALATFGDDGSVDTGEQLTAADWRAIYKEWSCPKRYLGFSPPMNGHGVEAARRPCTLYFIASDPYLKIGLAADVKKRMRQFQGGNPHPIRLAAYRTVPHCLARQVEKRMHLHFADRSIGREWFRDLDAKEGNYILHSPSFVALFSARLILR